LVEWVVQRILVLDPQDERRERLTFILRHAGFMVDVGGGGLHGTSVLRDCDPDLVVLAQEFPALEHIGAASLLLKLPDVPTIVLGEEQEEVAGIPYLELGADVYLPTPLNVRELLARVRSILGRRAMPAEGTGASRDGRVARETGSFMS